MNKNINIHNYEEFLIDFIDGTLNDEEHAAVVMFLENHPDIAEEFSGIADFNLDSCNIEFSDKEILKKSFDINLDNYEHYFIAASEGDLSSDEIVQLEEFIEQNPNLENEFAVFQNLKLSLLEEIPELELNTIKKIELSNGEFVSELDFENMCIAYFENDLAFQSKELLLSTIKFSFVAKRIFDEYSLVQLKADTNITFPNKSELKKKVIIPFWQSSAFYAPAVAASIAFFVLFYIFPSSNDGEIKSATKQATNNISVIDTDKQQENDNSIVYLNSLKERNNKEKTVLNTDIAKNINQGNQKLENNKSEGIIIRRKVDIAMAESIVCCADIGPDRSQIMSNMKLTIVKPISSFNSLDSGYFLVVAPPNKSLIAKLLPKRLRKTSSRVGKVFSERKAIIESNKTINSIESLAQIALNGFNKMTESDYSFKQRNSTDSKEDEENQK